MKPATTLPLSSTLILGLILSACTQTTPRTETITPESESSSETMVKEETPTKPTEGWGLHIDAKRHFTDDLSDPIAHHYCKAVRNSVTQCLLFDSDAADAQLVGVEVIVGPDLYATFSAEEKKQWHYHKDEIPKVEPVLPDLTAEEAAEVAKSIEETYGKLYILRNPAKSTTFTGSPYLTILK